MKAQALENLGNDMEALELYDRYTDIDAGNTELILTVVDKFVA